MKKYMIIVLISSFTLVNASTNKIKDFQKQKDAPESSANSANTSTIRSQELPRQDASKQNDEASAASQRQMVEVASKQPDKEKQSKTSLLGLFKCCCCGRVENN